jgi:D-alanyl-D-alanine carboxypeptidase
VAPAAPTPTGSASWPNFDGTIEAFLRNYGVDSASVAVAKDGRLVYVHAYGTSDPATGAPTRVDDRFRFASLTKVITTAAILRLVDAGRLDLDAPVLRILGARLPLPAGGDGRWNAVTTRELLGHDSGIPGSPDPFFNEAAGFAPGGAKTCQEAANWAVGRGLSSNPGTRFAYANMNFCLLGLVVEQVTGKPYLDAVRLLALDPVGAARVATGSTKGRLPGEVSHADTNPDAPGDGWFMESLLGAGSLVGTPTDLVKVLDGLDPSKPGNHLISTSTYGGMISPGPGSWGLGVRIFDTGFYGHTGSLASARSMAVHQPDGVTWAITTNGNFGDHGSVLFSVMSRALGTVAAWPAYDLTGDVPG